MLSRIGEYFAHQREEQARKPNHAVISLGHVWVDIMMDVNGVPKAGGFAVSDHTTAAVGGSYRVLQAVSRMGVSSQDRKSGSEECRDRSRMPSSA